MLQALSVLHPRVQPGARHRQPRLRTIRTQIDPEADLHCALVPPLRSQVREEELKPLQPLIDKMIREDDEKWGPRPAAMVDGAGGSRSAPPALPQAGTSSQLPVPVVAPVAAALPGRQSL